MYAKYWPIKLRTLFHGKYIGKDEVGNKYYQQYNSKAYRPRRWVIYENSLLESSLISPQWYGWLHHYLDEPLKNQIQKPWQMVRKPNMTGTPYAFHPEKNYSGPKEQKNTLTSYQAWIPI